MLSIHSADLLLFFGISGGMGTLYISIYYGAGCNHVFDVTKQMSAEGAYDMSGQTFLEPVYDLPPSLSFCTRICNTTETAP